MLIGRFKTTIRKMIEVVTRNLQSTTGILVAVASIVLTVLLYSHFKNLFRSRGPWGIPILGYYPFLTKDHITHLKSLTKKYGDPYVFSMLGVNYLYISSHKVAREVFLTKSDCFIDKADTFSLFQYVFNGGVLVINGEAWRVLRKFMMQSMREIGLAARESLKRPMSESLEDMMNFLKKKQGKPINIGSVISTQCVNVIRQLVLGNDVSDDIVEKINKLYIDVLAPMKDLGLLINGNIAKYFVAPKIEGFNKIFKAKKQLDKIFKDILDDHRKTFNPDDVRDLIDIFLREKKIKEEKNDPQAKYFTDEAFIGTIIQIYGDGGEGIGMVLTSYILQLASKLDVQNKMYNEIVREIGVERLPTYEDRQKLPLVNSVLKELERTGSTLIPVLTSAESAYDTTIADVFVPKGTVTMIDFVSIHHDPDVYSNPKHFIPERFLIDENTKRPKEDLPIGFGIGKRACIGEQLTTTEMFLVLVSIIQHFVIQTIDEQPLIEDQGLGKRFIDSIFEAEIRFIPRE